MYYIVEKKNHLAIHAVFRSLDSANKFLLETIPVYVMKSYYMDKTLTPDSFEIVKK